MEWYKEGYDVPDEDPDEPDWSDWLLADPVSSKDVVRYEIPSGVDCPWCGAEMNMIELETDGLCTSCWLDSK